MKDRTLSIVFSAVVFFVIGIAGAVEHGAGPGRMALTIPILLGMVLLINRHEKPGQKKEG